MFFDKFLTDNQSQTGAMLPGSTGYGVLHIDSEELFHVLSYHACSVIGYGQFHQFFHILQIAVIRFELHTSRSSLLTFTAPLRSMVGSMLAKLANL